MSEEITVKKENVLRAYDYAETYGATGTQIREFMRKLFPEVFEEKKEENEESLYCILKEMMKWIHGDVSQIYAVHQARKDIIKLAKKKVDEVLSKSMYSVVYHDELHKALEGL
jgi:hypothetical protein